MSKDDEDDEQISKESIESLEDARKGKSRKFVMICKGNSIQSLVVYKKGGVEKYIKQAKEVGKGQVNYGVISGKGQNLNFQLSREDGFDRAPVKTQVLRDFLKDNAKLTLKPLFEIVEATSLVLDDDDTLDRRFLALRDEAIALCDRHADRASEVNALCKEIGRHIDRDESPQAEKKLESLEKLFDELRKSKAEDAGEVTAPGSGKVRDADDAQASAEFTSRLKKLKPRIDEALTVKGSAAQVKRLVGEVAQHAKEKEFSQALATLDQLTSLLDDIETAAKSWRTQLTQIEPRYLDAVAASPPDVGKMRAIMAYAQEQAQDGEYAKGIAALKRLEPFLGGGAGGDPTAARNKALARYETARSKVIGQLTQLARAISESDAPHARDALIEIKSIHAQLTPKPDSRRSVDELIRYLETDDVVADADMPNKFGIDMDIQIPLLEALDELRETLPA